jgi:phosphoserine phosphatase
MRNFAESHDIDLIESWAYSDSASDLPMLRAVGNAVVVNPDTQLAEVARDEGWQVMRFDKLGRRLTIAAATITAALIGGGAATFARRRTVR